MKNNKKYMIYINGKLVHTKRKGEFMGDKGEFMGYIKGQMKVCFFFKTSFGLIQIF